MSGGTFFWARKIYPRQTTEADVGFMLKIPKLKGKILKNMWNFCSKPEGGSYVRGDIFWARKIYPNQTREADISFKYILASTLPFLSAITNLMTNFDD